MVKYGEGNRGITSIVLALYKLYNAGTAQNTTMNKVQKNHLIRRVMMMSTLILLLGLGSVFLLSQWLAEFFPTYYASIQTALMLFAIWLVVTSTLRSLQHLLPKIHAGLLLVIGTSITALSVLLYWAFLGIYGAVTIDYDIDFSWNPVWVFTGLGFIVSLMTLINLRIKDRAIGNVLEIVLMLSVLFFILYLTS